MSCYLIADSGSSKTDWSLCSDTDGVFAFHTAGINPVRDGRDTIFHVVEELRTQMPPQWEGVTQVFFYGAGCVPPYLHLVEEILGQAFAHAEVFVASDMLGAARALCGHSEGVACILGTGSNSCLYDGEKIVANIAPLGYILGDEGGGAVLGKTLISELYKGYFPPLLRQIFEEETGLTSQEIVARVYQQPQPNKFLASLVPFIHRHKAEPAIAQMLNNQFRLFIQHNVAHYNRPTLPLHFAGSVATLFCAELTKAVAEEGYAMGQVLQKPITHLVAYHSAAQMENSQT